MIQAIKSITISMETLETCEFALRVAQKQTYEYLKKEVINSKNALMLHDTNARIVSSIKEVRNLIRSA